LLPLLYLSILFDLTLGEPPVIIHPVVWVGKISSRLIKPFSNRFYGIFFWIVSVVPILFILCIPLYFPWYVELPLLVIFLKTTFSIKLLYSLVKKSTPVTTYSRSYSQQLVRRNVYELSEGHVRSAVIESLFESTVDGIISPIFWFLVLGYPGALLQRLANTMDSMVGYKTPEYREQGWFSAKLDTILNYIPARITALLMLLSAYLLGLRPKSTLRILKESKIESPNAKYPISFASSILNVRLEKIGFYNVGLNGWNLPEDNHVKIALNLFKVTLILFLAIFSILYYYLYGLSLFSYPYGFIELVNSKFMGY